MAKLPSLSAKEREDLVAYLDGELDANTARDLEAKLNLDAEARAEAEALRRTWEMLDYLPRPEPAAAFTSRTLERISSSGLHAVPAEAAKTNHGPPWLFGVGWAAAVLLAGTLGFVGVSWLSARNPAPTQATKPIDVDALLVRDLRLIENKRLYDLVDDVGFLRELDDPDLFGDDG
jgi:anti-sigma factor RsiW